MTRGGFSITAAGAALAALLAGPSVAEGTGKRTVVLTGASSGIGLDAATKLVRGRMVSSIPAARLSRVKLSGGEEREHAVPCRLRAVGLLVQGGHLCSLMFADIVVACIDYIFMRSSPTLGW